MQRLLPALDAVRVNIRPLPKKVATVKKKRKQKKPSSSGDTSEKSNGAASGESEGAPSAAPSTSDSTSNSSETKRTDWKPVAVLGKSLSESQQLFVEAAAYIVALLGCCVRGSSGREGDLASVEQLCAHDVVPCGVRLLAERAVQATTLPALRDFCSSHARHREAFRAFGGFQSVRLILDDARSDSRAKTLAMILIISLSQISEEEMQHAGKEVSLLCRFLRYL